MKIGKEYFRTETIYKNVGTSPREGQLGCGFIHTVSDTDVEKNANLGYYGGFLVLSGNGTYIGGDKENHLLKPGCFVQRIPGVAHTTVVHPAEEWLEFFIVFGADTYRTLERIGIADSRPLIYPVLDEVLFEKCKYLLQMFKSVPENENLLLYTSVLEFLLSVHCSADQKDVRETGNRDYEKLKYAARLLCCNLHSPMTAREAAEEIDMGYESFRKKFKNLYHISPSAYQLNYRINYAKTLLSDGEKKIEEVAMMCGFSDGFAFSKAFKKRCGISPGQFRKSIFLK